MGGTRTAGPRVSAPILPAALLPVAASTVKKRIKPFLCQGGNREEEVSIRAWTLSPSCGC